MEVNCQTTASQLPLRQLTINCSGNCLRCKHMWSCPCDTNDWFHTLNQLWNLKRSPKAYYLRHGCYYFSNMRSCYSQPVWDYSNLTCTSRFGHKPDHCGRCPCRWVQIWWMPEWSPRSWKRHLVSLSQKPFHLWSDTLTPWYRFTH